MRWNLYINGKNLSDQTDWSEGLIFAKFKGRNGKKSKWEGWWGKRKGWLRRKGEGGTHGLDGVGVGGGGMDGKASVSWDSGRPLRMHMTLLRTWTLAWWSRWRGTEPAPRADVSACFGILSQKAKTSHSNGLKHDFWLILFDLTYWWIYKSLNFHFYLSIFWQNDRKINSVNRA